ALGVRRVRFRSPPLRQQEDRPSLARPQGEGEPGDAAAEDEKIDRFAHPPTSVREPWLLRADLPVDSPTCYRAGSDMSRLALTLILAFVCAAPAPVRAASLRTWVDRDGVVHVDDYGAAGSRQGRRNSPARSTASTKGPRWWERRSDAPPDQIDRAAAMYNIPAELIRAVI